ncbi:MAG: hypothetical protein ACOX2J_04420 [Bacillota bacterium]|jgi:hypothetical protein
MGRQLRLLALLVAIILVTAGCLDTGADDQARYFFLGGFLLSGFARCL